MSHPAIKVEGLSKRYVLGQDERATSIREAVSNSLSAPFRRLKKMRGGGGDLEFWALKDVSFEIQPGEVVGVIGRNGAGKSTLLKILSRITPPTTGRITLRGRVASLLEVGTGFHPELTGRENIFLNGVMLGMKRREIQSKFDQIVDFSEIEKFLDTPVKRYSSGMYVRLAFAVAAHLDPEILIVDEVLAVGDAEFQRKCLGKIKDVARYDGRTVLFVSHQMGAVSALCTRAISMRKGQVDLDGPVEEVTTRYLANIAAAAQTDLETRKDRGGSGKVRVLKIVVTDQQESPVDQVMAGSPLRVEMHYVAEAATRGVVFQFTIYTTGGTAVFHCNNSLVGAEFDVARGRGVAVCVIPELPLPPGTYRLNLGVVIGTEQADHVEGSAILTVIEGNFFGTGKLPNAQSALALVRQSWTHGVSELATLTG